MDDKIKTKGVVGGYLRLCQDIGSIIREVFIKFLIGRDVKENLEKSLLSFFIFYSLLLLLITVLLNIYGVESFSPLWLITPIILLAIAVIIENNYEIED